MNKIKIAYCVLTFILCLCGTNADMFSQNFWITNDNAAHNIVWEGRLKNRIDFLTDTLCEGRATGTRGSSEAAFWITDKFRQAGLLPFEGHFARHIYAGHGLVGHNIIGMLPGSLTKPCDSYIIVGAHYDHLGILGGKMYPGADNNASGVAALLSLNDMFSAMKKAGRAYGKSLIFVAFDAEELNMAGSGAFWKMIEDGELTDPLSGKPVTKDKICAMVNIEQIGSTLSPLKSGRKDYLIALGNNTLERGKQDLLSRCNLFYGTVLELSETYYGSEKFTELFYGMSDQKVFAENGIPAVFFTSGITMNTFKTYDTVQTLDLEILRRRIILIYHWLEKLIAD